MAGLQSLFAFAETVKRGSFAGAARELGLTASAVAKSVARLEDDLGLRLLHRTTRRLALTSEGHELFRRCQAIVEEFEGLRDAAAGARGEPTGTLRINVPTTLGKRAIVPRLARLRERHPGIGLEVGFSDRYVDLIAEGLDAVVRVGPQPDSTLVSRRIGEQHLIVVGSPAYLRRRGEPARPDGLAQHACLLFRMPTSGRPRPWQLQDGRHRLEWTPDSPVVMNDGEALVVAAAEGLGLAQVPDYMARDLIDTGQLREVLHRHRPPAVPIALVYPSAKRVTPRLRALLQCLEGLSQGV